MKLRSAWLRPPYRSTKHFFEMIVDGSRRRFAQRAACGILRSDFLGLWAGKHPGVRCKRCVAYLERHRARRGSR